MQAFAINSKSVAMLMGGLLYERRTQYLKYGDKPAG